MRVWKKLVVVGLEEKVEFMREGDERKWRLELKWEGFM